MRKFSPIVLLLMAALGPNQPAIGQNPFGVQVSYIGHYCSDHLSKHYDDAVRLAGEWAHIRVEAFLHLPPEECAIPTLIATRAKHLIPIFTGQVPPGMTMPDDVIGLSEKEMDEKAKFFENWARKIYDAGFTIPYYEMGNEPQGRWPAETHARWCVAAAKAFHRVDPNIKVSPAGMAGPAPDYYNEMLTAVPELKDHMSVWSCHPYAANRPPQYDLDDLTIQGYRWTIDVLKRHGVADPKLILTETGWEIGGHADKRFPYITEDLRAEYIREAWTQYWAKDPHIVAVTPFMLQSLPWTGWETWDFMREDGSYTPQYHAMAAIPKPEGRDYLPSGDAHLTGRVTDVLRGIGIDRVFVWIVPAEGAGAYAAQTDADGYYTIENVPPGDYYVSTRKTRYGRAQRFPVRLESGSTAMQLLTMHRYGMVNTGFDEPMDQGIRSAHFNPFSMDRSIYAWDGSVGRTKPGSLRITPIPGEEHGYWVATGYLEALPGETYALEAWVKTENFVPGPDGGIRVALECTNANMVSHGEAWAPGPPAGTHDWTPVNVTVHAPERSRRHRIVLAVKGQSGKVWFDDVFADKAEMPVPSTVLLPSTERGGTLTGSIIAGDQSILHEATVYLTPGNYNALTDRMGRYRIEGIPEGKYRVSASHVRWSSHRVEDIEIKAGGVASVNIILPDRDWPEDLVNGDMETYGYPLGVMVGWKPYGINDGDGAVKSGWMASRANPGHPGFQARSGNGLLGYVSAYNTKNGCSYQTVRAEPNALYELTAWIKTCRRGGVRGDVANRIGIDPMGLDDPLSPYIIWTPFRPSPDRWSEVKLQARANRNRITIFLGHKMISGIAWSGNFFDDVVLRKIEGATDEHDVGLTEGEGDAHLPYEFK